MRPGPGRRQATRRDDGPMREGDTMRRLLAGPGRYLGILLVLLLTLQVLAVPGAAAAPAPDGPQAEAVPDQVLVGFEPNADEAARDAVVGRRGGRTLEKLDSINVRVVQLPPGRAV